MVQPGARYPGEGRARARSRHLDRPSPQGEPALPAGEPDSMEETAPGGSRGRPTIPPATTSSASETGSTLRPRARGRPSRPPGRCGKVPASPSRLSRELARGPSSDDTKRPPHHRAAEFGFALNERSDV